MLSIKMPETLRSPRPIDLSCFPKLEKGECVHFHEYCLRLSTVYSPKTTDVQIEIFKKRGHAAIIRSVYKKLLSVSFHCSPLSKDFSSNLNSAGKTCLCVRCAKYINHGNAKLNSLGFFNSSRETATFTRSVHADMRTKWEKCEFCLGNREPVAFISPLLQHYPVEDRYFHYTFKAIFDAYPKDPVLEVRISRLRVLSDEWATCKHCIPGLSNGVLGLLVDSHCSRPQVVFQVTANVESIVFFYLYLHQARRFLANSDHKENLCDTCINYLRKTCLGPLLAALNVPHIVPELFVTKLSKVIYALNDKCPYGCKDINLVGSIPKPVLEGGVHYIHEIWNYLENRRRIHLVATENVAQMKLDYITM